ncbi:MAG TPA: hypothetical protein VFN55_03335 [Solirubrobacteraceae bacterium]|nr:hypothetical protein [Solirubrobacteraceae bacterium]
METHGRRACQIGPAGGPPVGAGNPPVGAGNPPVRHRPPAVATPPGPRGPLHLLRSLAGRRSTARAPRGSPRTAIERIVVRAATQRQPNAAVTL